MPAKIKKSKKVATLPKINTCIHKGCNKSAVMMKRNRKTKQMDHWCASHWKIDVEAKSPKSYKDTSVKRPITPAKKKRVVKKKSESASGSKKRKVVKR